MFLHRFHALIHSTRISLCLCFKRQGGWVAASTRVLPLFSTASKHPTTRNARNFNPFIRLLQGSRDTRGGITSSLRGKASRRSTRLLRVSRAHSASLCYPFPLFVFQLSTVNLSRIIAPRELLPSRL